MLGRGRVHATGRTGASSHPYPSSLTHTGCFPLNALSVAMCLLSCCLLTSSLQAALCCLCSSVHTQSTYQHPASHFVFLRAPAGLDSQVLPVPRQKLHPLDTILSSNYLNRRAGMGKNFEACLCWNCMLNHTCTQINISYTSVLYAAAAFPSVSVSPYPPLVQPHYPSASAMRLCSPCPSSNTQSGTVSWYGWCWAVGCASMPCADLASQNSCACSQGCAQPWKPGSSSW